MLDNLCFISIYFRSLCDEIHSGYTVNLSVNLEPIYAIIFALLIFKNTELMNLNFYIGSLIVVGSILLNALFKKTKKAT